MKVNEENVIVLQQYDHSPSVVWSAITNVLAWIFHQIGKKIDFIYGKHGVKQIL